MPPLMNTLMCLIKGKYKSTKFQQDFLEPIWWFTKHHLPPASVSIFSTASWDFLVGHC